MVPPGSPDGHGSVSWRIRWGQLVRAAWAEGGLVEEGRGPRGRRLLGEQAGTLGVVAAY